MPLLPYKFFLCTWRLRSSHGHHHSLSLEAGELGVLPGETAADEKIPGSPLGSRSQTILSGGKTTNIFKPPGDAPPQAALWSVQ
ncbi:hypothetical protein CapIbe_005406 [Capra ibex]